MHSWLLPSYKQTNQSGKRNRILYRLYIYQYLSTEINSYIILHDISDHFPIHLTVNKTRLKRDIKQRFVRDTRNVDIIALTEICTKF